MFSNETEQNPEFPESFTMSSHNFPPLFPEHLFVLNSLEKMAAFNNKATFEGECTGDREDNRVTWHTSVE
jgi:hypothetical protein